MDINAKTSKQFNNAIEYLDLKDAKKLLEGNKGFANLTMPIGFRPLEHVIRHWRFNDNTKSNAMIELLLNHGAYNGKSINGPSTFLLAARECNLETIQIFLDHGSSINESWTSDTIWNRPITYDFFYYAKQNKDPKVNNLTTPAGRLWLRYAK